MVYEPKAVPSAMHGHGYHKSFKSCIKQIDEFCDPSHTPPWKPIDQASVDEKLLKSFRQEILSQTEKAGTAKDKKGGLLLIPSLFDTKAVIELRLLS